MNKSLSELVHIYLRAVYEHRKKVALACIALAVFSLLMAASWPKTYTASSTIYADNSNILRPLMSGSAVTTDIEDQARMAQDILFSRDFNTTILEASGRDLSQLTDQQIEGVINGIRSRTTIENVRRGNANLVRIAHTDANPIVAFSITQAYTRTFIEESVVTKQDESRSAFEFIQNQVGSYQSKLQESETRLSQFKSENNFGTLSSANTRISQYRANIEQVELELVQLDAEMESVEAQLAGENQIVRDMSQINSVQSRINALQLNLDALRSRFHDTYPDVVQVKNQIADLQAMLESEDLSSVIGTDEAGGMGIGSLHQQLRSQMANLAVQEEAKLTQLDGLRSLLLAEQERARRINETEAELAELTRDYTVTQRFYEELLMRLENARVSMHLDEEQQGITFKVQESAVIPVQPDGFSFTELMTASFAISLGLPIGLVILFAELDPRIRSESSWSDDWPPLVATVPPLTPARTQRNVDRVLVGALSLVFLSLYVGAGAAYVTGIV